MKNNQTMQRYWLWCLFAIALLVASGCPQGGRVGPPPPRRMGQAPEYCPPVAVQPESLPVTVMEPAPSFQPIAGQTVILDAGHGGQDLGAAHFGLREKDINLDLTLRTAALLRSRGVAVQLTRQSDVSVSLPERSAFANKYPNAVLVSIHVNASAKNPAARGIETFVLSPQFTDADRSRTIASRFRVSGTDSVQSAQALANLAATCRAKGPALASALQQSMTSRLGEPDRGVKTANLSVLRETYFCPAVLVEVGFLTNPATAQRMATEQWRRLTAEALADGIAAFLRQS
ncbi:MAG: N-acetylmuramoyl-L-alanine amidase [Planctomycetes bacterium]|nr:N-acetylmuramoyl-L-alanine amidase [Planctomycetota bacterium]